MNSIDFGKFIRELRKKNNLTQKQLADRCGVTYQAVSKWENGKNIPDISILKDISEQFQVSLDDILNGEYVKKKEKKYKILIIAAIIFSIISIFLIIIIKNNSRNFEFKTLSTTCNNFTISGNISYNYKKSAIYISNIDYCGGNDNNKYYEIECILYEKNKSNDIEISSYKYSDFDNPITLEEFLKDVSFVIDSYSSVCQNYSNDSLSLIIRAKLEDKEINYNIPLSLNDNCK